MAGSTKQLLVEVPGLGARLDTLLRRLSRDEQAVKDFMADPVGVIRREVTPGGPTSSQASISSGNRFVQRALANDDFRQWARGFQHQLTEKAKADTPISREEVLKEIANAMIRARDPKLLAAWTEHLADSPAQLGHAVVVDEIAVARIAVVVALAAVLMIDFTPAVPGDANMVSPHDVRTLGDQIVKAAKASRP